MLLCYSLDPGHTCLSLSGLNPPRRRPGPSFPCLGDMGHQSGTWRPTRPRDAERGRPGGRRSYRDACTKFTRRAARLRRRARAPSKPNAPGHLIGDIDRGDMRSWMTWRDPRRRAGDEGSAQGRDRDRRLEWQREDAADDVVQVVQQAELREDAQDTMLCFGLVRCAHRRASGCF